MRSALVMVALLGGLHARAMCAPPGPFVLPAPGSSVPANPTLYYFSFHGAEAGAVSAITDSGLVLKVDVTTLKTQGDLGALRLQVQAPSNIRFSLTGLAGVTVHRSGQAADQQKFGSWTTNGQVTRTPLVLKRAEDISTKWTCSHTALRTFESSLDAPAYQVEFAPTEQELRAGNGSIVIVEGRNDTHAAFAERLNERLPERPPRIALGFHNCAGSNFTTGKVALRVTALMPDGSTRPSREIFVLERLQPPVLEDP